MANKPDGGTAIWRDLKFFEGLIWDESAKVQQEETQRPASGEESLKAPVHAGG